MTWIALLQAMTPGLIALLGAWRAHSKTTAQLAELTKAHAKCERNVAALREELGLKRRDETAGGGALHRSTNETRKP